MHFLLSTMSVVYVLNTPIPDDGDDAIVEQIRRRNKLKNDDYVCHGIILNEVPCKSLVSLINSLLLAKNFKHTLKHKKEELTLVELGSHLRIEESHRVQDSDKPKSNNVDGPSVVNMLEHNNSIRYNDNKGKRKYQDTKTDPNKKSKQTCWKYGKPGHLKKDCKGGKVGNKANGNKKYFVTFIDDASRTDIGGEYMDILYFQSFGIIHETTALYTPQQDGISERKNRVLKEMVNSMLSYLGLNVIFDENRLSSVLRPSLRIPNGTKDIGGSVVLEEITKEVVQQLEPELRKSKRNGTPKNFGHGFQLYLIEGIKDEKEAINDEMYSIMGNNTWVLVDLHPGCKPLGFKWIFKRKLKVDLTKEFLSSRFSMKDMGEVDVILGIRIKHESNGIAISKSHYIKKVLTKFNYFDCTPVSTPMDTSEKVMPNNGQAVSQLEYSRVIDCLMYVMTCTRPDIAFAVGKLRRYTSNPVLEGYTDASWISNSEDNSSTNDWVFLLGGGVIS
ncbi:zinc finger, CCHC-type containing protein [Tanacetum coccineum]